jgi:hypothetical protein
MTDIKLKPEPEKPKTLEKSSFLAREAKAVLTERLSRKVSERAPDSGRAETEAVNDVEQRTKKAAVYAARDFNKSSRNVKQAETKAKRKLQISRAKQRKFTLKTREIAAIRQNATARLKSVPDNPAIPPENGKNPVITSSPSTERRHIFRNSEKNMPTRGGTKTAQALPSRKNVPFQTKPDNKARPNAKYKNFTNTPNFIKTGKNPYKTVQNRAKTHAIVKKQSEILKKTVQKTG